jgi:hypothetical protein
MLTSDKSIMNIGHKFAACKLSRRTCKTILKTWKIPFSKTELNIKTNKTNLVTVNARENVGIYIQLTFRSPICKAKVCLVLNVPGYVQTKVCICAGMAVYLHVEVPNMRINVYLEYYFISGSGL